MRIAIGMFIQESHSFSPTPGSWDHFGPENILIGQEILDFNKGKGTEIGGAIDVAQSREVELVPLLAARASTSTAPIERNVFETIRNNLLEQLRKSGQLDGVLFVGHGAMLAEDYDDATGELLRSLRSELNESTPVVLTLDLHANVTQHMVDNTNALVGYHTFPHVDIYQTGKRGMNLLYSIIKGEVQPATSLRRLPMILPGENGRTDEGPFAEVMRKARDLIKHSAILDVSVFCVQPWLDIKDVGCSVVVTTNHNRDLAEQSADHIADEFWSRREDFLVELAEPTEAIRKALQSNQRPFVFADGSDAPSSGAPGDSPIVLRALLEAEPSKDCYVNIVDPPAVKEMIVKGVGNKITLRIGGKFVSNMYSPIEVTGYVSLLSEGSFVQKAQVQSGVTCYRGLTGVLKIGHVYLVIMEHPVPQWDPELYRSVGLEPKDAQIVVVKSPTGFRAAYEIFAAEIMNLDTPGVASPNLRRFPFKNVQRPLYPLDDIEDWRRVS